LLARPQVSVIKRQREQAKRERQQVKAAKRAQRKDNKGTGDEFGEVTMETPMEPEVDSEAETV
jgi:hypothetical protein